MEIDTSSDKPKEEKVETAATETPTENQEVAVTVEQPTPTPAKESAPVIKQEAVVEKPADKNAAVKEVTVPVANKAAQAQNNQKQKVASNISDVESDNPRVRQFTFQVNKYIDLTRSGLMTEKVLTERLIQFTQIIRAIINSTDPAVYNAAYHFFKDHRNDILSEKAVFQYIHKLPTELFIRVQTVYTLFRELVEANTNGKRFCLDYGLIRDNMKLPAQHPLLNWVRRRLNK